MVDGSHNNPPIPAAPLNQEEYEQLLDDYSHLAPPSEGELLTGTVLAVNAGEVIVDFGYKTEGIVPIEQLRRPDGAITVKAGDPIDVVVDRGGGPAGTYVMLSHQKALRLRAWDNLEQAFRENLVLSGRVLGRVKGGLSVDVGVVAFMPSSQVDPRPVHNLDVFVGQDIPVKIIKINRRRGNVVVSRQQAVEQEINLRKSATLEQLEEGAVLVGVVKNLTDYGAFVDLGGIDGLLHVSDMSYGRVNHPSEVVNPGDSITVKVIKLDKAKERVSLGLRQMLPDPWDSIAERYPIGSHVVGTVVSITDYGAFVELEPGVEGLIHITEMTWSRRLKHPSKLLKPNDQVAAVVLAVTPAERRISLGVKQMEPDPWTTLEQRYSVGSVVEGRVRKLVDFGVFVEIEEGVDGLVHVADLSWTQKVKHPSEMLKRGQIIQAVILNIDAQHRRLSLSVKHLTPDAWETFFQQHQVGDVIEGKVVREANFGVFVEVAEGVEGLCHTSEFPRDNSGAKIDVGIGTQCRFKIIKLLEAEKRIGLSIRQLSIDDEGSRLSDYQRQATAATMTIGEVIHLKSTEPEE